MHPTDTLLGVMAVALLVAGCQSSHRGGGGARGDAGEVREDAAVAGVCCGCETPEFPTFDGACAADGDCFAALHQVDCCGSVAALGVSTSERAGFDAAEEACRGMYPGCGCPAGPMTLDDGSTCFGAAEAHCVEGTCRTSCLMAAP